MQAILIIDDHLPLRKLLSKMVREDGANSWPKIFRIPARNLPPQQIVGEEALKQILRELMKEEKYGHLYEGIISKIERIIIGITLEEEQGNQLRAAKRLGINRNTLRKKLCDLAIISRVVAE